MNKNILKNCLKKGIPTEILIVCKGSEGSRYSYLGKIRRMIRRKKL